MKRVQITPQIEQYVRRSLGDETDLASLNIYEAIALNTRPLRKRHPLYNSAVADRSILREMAARLSSESVPLQIEHAHDSNLPKGRVFHGEVVEMGNEAELRVLFFVSAAEQEAILKINEGTVDQVSVSVVPKHLYSSATGFDFLGPDADFDNVFMGIDDKGNIMGENGVYARMVGLDSWFEMSLVGQGGAQNARIVRRNESHFGSSFQKLAASGVDPNAFVLTASASVEESMDLTQLIDQLTTVKAELTTKTAEIAALTAQVADLTAANAELTTARAQAEAALASDETASQLAQAQTEVASLKSDVDAGVAVLKDMAKAILTAAGKLNADIPETVSELKALIESTKADLAARLVVGGKSEGADAASTTSAVMVADNSAFRTSRK